MTRTRLLTWAIAATSAAVIAATAIAASNPVPGRQAAMKGVAAGMKDASGVLGAFDAAKAKAAMTAVASNAATARGLFPAGSDKDPKSGAGPKIWTSRADFDKRLGELVTLATAASKARTADAFKPAFQKVGATCKGCHDLYRLKKK
jgi:cytochrome c556